MDRRDFLKSIGLGAVAFTVPRPLEVIAAKVADLEAPPLHVGYAGLDCNRSTGGISGMGLQVKQPMSPERLEDLMRNWTAHVIIQRPYGYMLLAECPVKHLVFLDTWGEHYIPGSLLLNDSLMAPDLMNGGISFLRGSLVGFMDHDRLEVWLVPTGQPRFTLCPLYARFFTGSGWPRTTPGSSPGGPFQGYVHTYTLPVRKARIERAQALKLGLI